MTNTSPLITMTKQKLFYHSWSVFQPSIILSRKSNYRLTKYKYLQSHHVITSLQSYYGYSGNDGHVIWHVWSLDVTDEMIRTPSSSNAPTTKFTRVALAVTRLFENTAFAWVNQNLSDRFQNAGRRTLTIASTGILILLSEMAVQRNERSPSEIGWRRTKRIRERRRAMLA